MSSTVSTTSTFLGAIRSDGGAYVERRGNSLARFVLGPRAVALLPVVRVGGRRPRVNRTH